MTIKDCWFEALFRATGKSREQIERAHPNHAAGIQKHVPHGTEEKWIYQLKKAIDRCGKTEQERRDAFKPIFDEMLLVAEARDN